MSLHKWHYVSLQIDYEYNHRRSIKLQNKSLEREYKTADELYQHNYDDSLPTIKIYAHC